MKSTRRGWPMIAALVVPLLLSAGCTGSDVLDTGNAGVVVRVALSNPNARFDRASQASITQLNVRPADPDANATLGTLPIAVFATADDIVNIDFRDDTLDDPSRVLLSSGGYNISTLQFTNIILAQNNRPTTWTQCSEFHTWVLTSLVFTAADLGAQSAFGVQADGNDEVLIELDADAFIDTFVNSWNCTNTPSGPVPTSFNAALFKSQSATYLRIVG